MMFSFLVLDFLGFALCDCAFVLVSFSHAATLEQERRFYKKKNHVMRVS
jgi:hypothetical protein